MTDSRILCIHHHPCMDGFGAAWAVWKRLGDQVQFVPGIYGMDPPDVTGRDVVLVDFSYRKDVMCELSGLAKSVLIIDHHKTAQEALAWMPKAPDSWDEWVAALGKPGLHRAALFDMDHSGAALAWSFFHPGKPKPRLIEHIEDRDLWRFRLDGTRDISALLSSETYDFHRWDGLIERSNDPSGLQLMLLEGGAINRHSDKMIEEMLPLCTRRMVIGGVEVPVSNMPYFLASDAANRLANGSPFAATYYDSKERRVFSLRSTTGIGADVSEIANRYGGGGHRHASGFSMPLGWSGDR